LKSYSKNTGNNLYYQARGSYPARLTTYKAQKSVSKETTFNEDINDPQHLKHTLQKLAFNVARSLRKKGYLGNVVNIRVRLADFTTFTRQCKLERATDSDVEIARIGWELFEQHGYVGQSLRLIGIGVVVGDDAPSNNEAEQVQFDLFMPESKVEEESDDKKGSEVITTIDEILDKFGEDSIRRGGRSI